MRYTVIHNIKKSDTLKTETWTGQEFSISEMKKVKILFDFETVEVSDNVIIMQGAFGDDYYQMIFIEE